MSKYGNRRTFSERWHRNFHSAAECRFADEVLWPLWKAKKIEQIQFQKSVKLLDAVSMRVDYYYFDNERDCWVWHEYKGFATDTWRMQRKLWAKCGPGLYIVTRKTRHGYTHEEIWPENQMS